MATRKVYRIIIAGSRDFTDYAVVEKEAGKIIDELLSKNPDAYVEIISGNARGADLLGERFACEKGYRLWRFPANWTAFGHAAGPIRNRAMLEFAMDREAVLIAFWNGKSRGTANMVDIAHAAGIPIYRCLVSV